MRQQPASSQLFVVCEGRLLLILRDDKPDIKDDPENGIHFPNCWALPGGGMEEGEDFFRTAARELFEELTIKFQLQILGVSQKGNCYFFGSIDRQLADQKVTLIIAATTLGVQNAKVATQTILSFSQLDPIRSKMGLSQA